jgi:hypothetical protein
MRPHCQIPNAIEKVFSASHCNTAFVGGSLTVGVGASDVSGTSWRALFMRYLYGEYQRRYHCQPSEVMGGIGASESYVAVFTLPRNVLPAKPDLAMVEFCVNDRNVPDESLVIKGMEGIVRQLLMAKTRCEVMILGMGVRDGDCDQSLHRRVAEHYGLPFVDMQGYLHQRLKDEGKRWDDAAIPFVEKDNWHLNDYGNRVSFEAIRDCFEDQVALFRSGARRDRNAPVPEPLVSDELQFVKLVDPAVSPSGLTLEGQWQPKLRDQIPWYFDNVLMGQPGSRLVFEFEGTAVAVYGLVFHNGLKLEAVLDGEAVAGPYLRHQIEFGKGMVLAHGMAPGKHVLELTVGQPSKRHNKLGNPVAQLAYIGVAGK